LRIRLFHIADDSLPAIVPMDVLDAAKLLAAATQPLKDLNLGCTSPCFRFDPPEVDKSLITSTVN
jgi:hypothetical protein